MKKIITYMIKGPKALYEWIKALKALYEWSKKGD
jgi:hypothetical protein